MKIALLAAATLMSVTETAQAPQPAQAPGPQVAARTISPDRPGCVPIARQIAGPDRPAVGVRLDQQPPARALLAVDRRVGGCHEVTLVSEERARR